MRKAHYEDPTPRVSSMVANVSTLYDVLDQFQSLDRLQRGKYWLELLKKNKPLASQLHSFSKFEVLFTCVNLKLTRDMLERRTGIPRNLHCVG